MEMGGPCVAGPSSRPSCAAAQAPASPPAETTSTSVTQTVNGSHQFKITGYSLSKGLGVGKYIASDTFQVGGYSWAIYFYPDGKSPEDNGGYVSLFIALASEGTDVRALFELTLMDQSGRGRHKVHSHFRRNLEGGPYTLKYRGSMWGYKRFFKRTALESSDYLKDDCLLVHCSVGVLRTHTEGPKVYSIAVPQSNIGQHFGQLLESGKATDVNFEVDGEIFHAHKLVLATRSPVFRAQLFGPMKDRNTACIKVEDMEAPVFKAAKATFVGIQNRESKVQNIPKKEGKKGAHQGGIPKLHRIPRPHYTLKSFHITKDVYRQILYRLPKAVDWHSFVGSAQTLSFHENSVSKDDRALLHFIYWDSLPDMEELTGLNTKWASTLMAQHLLAAADRYALERLRLLCETKLCEDVAINTVATTLALAEQHHCFQLKTVCLKFVARPENLRAVMQTDGFEYLKMSCPSLLTEILEYVAKIGEHCVISCAHPNEALDGSDAHGRRVKQRI